MACTRPLYAFYGPAREDGKVNVVWHERESARGRRLDLPCGQCPGCRLERSRQWAVRCMHEASMHERNCFITLTYDDAHYPPGGSLVLSDFQNFMKRLRKEHGAGIRFFHCGEYGKKLSRPHFHSLLFNFDFSDRELFNDSGSNPVYTSAMLDRLWGRGFSLIGDVTYASAAYVARYVVKKNLSDSAPAHYGDKRPEYITMSRNPGIGAGWFKKYRSDVYPSDEVVVDGKVFRPPRFYDNLLDREDLNMLNMVKMKREAKAAAVDPHERSAGRLIVKEEVHVARLKSLKRPLEDR